MADPGCDFKDSEDADAHFEVANLYSRRNDPAQAVEHSRIAADLFYKRGDVNGASQAYWQLGWDYYFFGKFEESLKASTEALRFDPNLAPVYFNIGLVLLHMGRDAEAQP